MNQASHASAPDMSGRGYLIVRVSTARGAIPIEGARVTIRTHEPEAEIRGVVIRVLVSNRDGNTETIVLPAPPRAASMDPYGELPFTTYNIDVEKSGYYPLYFSNVPVYDTITSIQPAVLIPISENGNTDNATRDNGIFNETTNPNLRA